MKKSLIALAAAGAFAAPAFAATSNVDFYGQVRVSVDHLNNVNGTTGGWGMNDETSRMGVKGSEDLGGGLKAIYQWETGFDAGVNGANNGATGLTTGTTNTGTAGGLGGQRNTFVGLAGDFGTVLAGRHDTPYKLAGSADRFGDTFADAQNTGTRCIICEDLRVANAVAYVSPTMSGFSFIGAIVPGSYHQSTATTKSQNSLTDAYSLAGMYNNGPLSLSAAYENLGHIVSAVTTSGADGKQNAWKLNGGYKIGDLTLGATYESIEKIGGVTTGADGSKSKNYLLSAAYAMGPITLAAQYGERNPNGSNNELKDVTLGATYNMSKRTNTYLNYAHYKPGSAVGVLGSTAADLGQKMDVWSIGMNHSF